MRTAFRWSPLVHALIGLTLLASALSFLKSEHCRSNLWSSPDVVIHACYSDIPALFTTRHLDEHQWAYKGGSTSVEYPVLMGVVMWATAWLVPSGDNSPRTYFDINIFFIALLLLASVLIVGKIRPEFAYLLPLSPAVIASLYINWDLWGIATMLLSIYFFDRQKYSMSAVVMAVSISIKFFPVLLMMPAIFILWRRNEIRKAAQYLSITVGIWLLINLPVVLTTPRGWWTFYQLNISRDSEWGSIWYALSLLGLDVKNLNYISILVFLAIISAMAIYLFELPRTPTLAQVSFILMAGVLCVGKVYSPQYVLWLVPLAVIAMTDKRALPAFWIWQIGEGIYHIAIWQHLASGSGGSHFGLPAGGYALASLFRVATCAYFIAVIVALSLKNRSPQAQDSHRRLSDFLFGSSSSYP
jgi:uncharacterized membrane protein